MNNRGFYSLFSIFFMFCLIIAGTVLLSNDARISEGLEPLKSLNISWNNVSPTELSSNTLGANVTLFMYDFINFIGYWMFEFAKIVTSWAGAHPEINGELLITAAILIVLIPLVYPLFLIIVSLVLIVKEWLQNRKKRREGYGTIR